ncbi:MAG: MBOAT family protein, partial [Clostridia bacterium]|nr:MBOAT family protein [Clostridia bacterium]
MLFSSLEFLFGFLPITLLLYYILPPVLRNPVLLLVSLFFYGWGEPVNILLMVGTILFDYGAGFLVGHFREKNDKAAKAVLIISVIANLALLGFFKYYDFFAVNLSRLPFISIKTRGISLPIGISFYTFQIMSYVIDVYRGDAKVQKNPISLGAYVTLFPQLIAGPIVRYRDVDDQLRERTCSSAMFASGIRTFLAGLAKKVIFANTVGAMCDAAVADPERTVFGSWLGLICFCFQIYFDFSGYS